MTATDESAELQEAVLLELRKRQEGRPALDVVNVVAKRSQTSDNVVRREVRTLLERGKITIGRGLNLVAR